MCIQSHTMHYTYLAKKVVILIVGGALMASFDFSMTFVQRGGGLA